MTEPTKQDLIAQWAFDTRSILLRFHLWLEDIEIEWRPGSRAGYEAFNQVPAEIRRSLAMTAAVTALGTRLFARFGEGRGADKHTLNQVKKDADAISAYVTSEALWHFSRKLPENHAIMVCLGEGLMPKAGETPEMGANPLLGFGRVYARPEVANPHPLRPHRAGCDAGGQAGGDARGPRLVQEEPSGLVLLARDRVATARSPSSAAPSARATTCGTARSTIERATGRSRSTPAPPWC